MPNKIEGEGSYSGTRDYNKRTEKFIDAKGDKIKDLAEDAAESLEGKEGETLKRAEKAGKKKARH